MKGGTGMEKPDAYAEMSAALDAFKAALWDAVNPKLERVADWLAARLGGGKGNGNA